MQIKVWAVKQKYAWLDFRINLKNCVNSTKFNYLKFVKLRVKN